MMGTFAHFVVLAVMIVLAVHKDSGLSIPTCVYMRLQAGLKAA